MLEYYQGFSNDVPGLTITHFTARSNLVPYAFVLEKLKTMDFSETIVVYDINVGRYSQLNESFMSARGHLLTLVQITQIQYFIVFFPDKGMTSWGHVTRLVSPPFG